MSEPFLAEIKMFGFNFAPRGWAYCDGQILPINQNQSLYSLLGTTYGGDGRSSFGLPDLRGRVPIHTGTSSTQGASNHLLGTKGGEEAHTLQINAMPAHTHGLNATDGTPASANATGARLAPAAGGRRPVVPYGAATGLTPLHENSIDVAGGQGHNTLQPSLVIGFAIALQGLFPSRN